MLVLFGVNGAAYAQKAGGTLRGTLGDNAAQPSIHEEIDGLGRRAVDGGVQQPGHLRPARRAATASTRSVPDLATGWTWSEDGTALTFTLRQGVKWHDGKPFTAADVQCTLDLLHGQGRSEAAASIRARRGTATSTRSRPTAISRSTFHLKRPQPALHGAPRGGLVADLSLPRVAGADAAAIRSAPARSSSSSSSRNEYIKLERTPTTGSRAGPISTASSTRSSRNRATRDAGLRRRQVRHDLPDRRHRAAAEGREERRCRSAICDAAAAAASAPI